MSIALFCISILCLKGKATADVLCYLVIIYCCLRWFVDIYKSYDKQKGVKS